MSVEEKRKSGWIEAVFNIEAMAVSKEVAEKALKEHVERMEKAKDVFVYEKNFMDVQEIDNPPKNVEKAYSQVVEVKLFVKDLLALIGTVVLYGPSSIEILSPKSKEVSMEEMQLIANALAGMIHQFAQAGAGGIVFTPK